MQFPLNLDYPVMLYQEISETSGQWQEVEQFTIKVPKNWDLDGNVNDYNVFGLGFLDQTFRNSQANNLNSIIVDHTTDLHYSATFSYFTKKPFYLDVPSDQFNVNSYKYIFFKKKKEDESLLLDIIGLHQKEQDIDRKITFIIQQLLYESKYSEIGIRKQVEDAVENVFYQSLKKIIRLLGNINNVEYESMYELTKKVLYCEQQTLNKEDIKSIVYKTLITVGLFPFYCEINTMNDSFIKLKLISMFTNSEILPWSPKFHASLGNKFSNLALGNYHYSFTPNDLFNQRTLHTRTFHKGYQYIRLKILDFFPLDSWIEDISQFFIENLNQILSTLRKQLPQEIRKSTRKGSIEPQSNSRSSILDLKEPLMREESKETELIRDSLSGEQMINNITNCSESFKSLLRTTIRQIENVREVFGIVIHTPYIVKIKNQIAIEFYQNYSAELNRNGILSHFCSIITETELRSYDRCANNCQTPVAAFIYLLCDTFRPYSEMLYEKTTFIHQSIQQGFNIINYQSRHNPNIKSSLIDSECKQLPKLMEAYCKFASAIDLQLLSDLFIQPAVLEFSLDYFGFYSDELSKEFLGNIQNIDFNPDQFQTQQKKSIFQPKIPNTPESEVNLFMQAYEISLKRVIQKYQNFKLPQRQNLVPFLQSLMTDEQFYTQSKFNIHYMMQHFQNQIIKIKQSGIKRAKAKHLIQDCQDFANYIYFNSIRLQLLQKQRNNTLSLIGYVVAKDVNKINTKEPCNIDLQIKQ